MIGTFIGMHTYTMDVPIALRVVKYSSTITYMGTAEAGSLTSDPVWRICQLTDDGTNTASMWADGNLNFDNIWDNYASLSYA